MAAIAAAGVNGRGDAAPIPVVTAEPIDHGIRLGMDPGVMEIIAIGDRSLRVRYGPDATLPNPPDAVHVALPGASEWTADADPSAPRVSTPSIEARVDPASGAIRFLDPGTGAPLLEEPADGGKAFIPATVDGEGATLNARQRFVTPAGAAIYGLGQHQTGWMDHRGRDLELWQQNMEVAWPVVVTTAGAGLLWNNPSLTTFSETNGVMELWSEVADQIDYDVYAGPDLDGIVGGYREATGTAPLPPRWAFGYIQSKERYTNQVEILDIVREYRARGLPLDVIVQDWRYWRRWGAKEFEADRFPDPTAMISEIHDDHHARFMISIWPSLADGSTDYTEMLDAGFLYLDLGRSHYDAFNDDARTLFWEQTRRGLFTHGADAWFCDSTEPALFFWDTRPIHLRNVMKPAIGSGARFMNAYSLYHSRGMYEGQRGEASGKRVFILTRAGFPGVQRYATAVWSGDISARWDVLRDEIPAGLNFCAGGLPYWCADIGGFFVHPGDTWYWAGDYPDGVDDPAYRELYVRWFQYGAFCPIFRAHGTDTPREIWRFGEPGDWEYDALVDATRLRYRLLPYIYSLAWDVTHRHGTMMRALAFDFRDDASVHDIDDQFMFGPALMISPVTSSNTVSRTVRLPAGTGWRDFWSGQTAVGGVAINAPAPRDRIPIHVRFGSIVPMGPFLEYTDQHPPDPIELRVYRGADGSFTLYEDEGDGYGYETGARAEIPIEWDDDAGVLTIGARAGSFPGMPTTRTFEVTWVAPGRGVGLGIEPSPDRRVEYDGSAVVVTPPQASILSLSQADAGR